MTDLVIVEGENKHHMIAEYLDDNRVKTVCGKEVHGQQRVSVTDSTPCPHCKKKVKP